MVRVDEMGLRFNFVQDLGAGAAPNRYRYQVVLPYKNQITTGAGVSAGIGADANPDYERAQFAISHISHKKGMELLVADARPLNPEMPYGHRDFGGKWKFAMHDLGADANGVAISNKWENKGQFIAWFVFYVRPLHYDFMEAWFHRREQFCIPEILDPAALPAALEGASDAYYLVHSMGGRRIRDAPAFAERDRRAAANFLGAAASAGLGRIVCLGGLGEDREGLSEHLTSRHEVARILGSDPRVSLTTLRAAVIIGAGGASFEILRHLVERLPVMLCPRWIDTRCQPIAVDDVTAYLVGCLKEPATAGFSFDIGGPEVLTYRTLMLMYARVRRLRRLIVPAPVMTPRLSAYWINLLTPVPAGVVFPLVEGLRNEVICRDNRIRELLPIRLAPMNEAICAALAEEKGGPGQLPSRQALTLWSMFHYLRLAMPVLRERM